MVTAIIALIARTRDLNTELVAQLAHLRRAPSLRIARPSQRYAAPLLRWRTRLNRHRGPSSEASASFAEDVRRIVDPQHDAFHLPSGAPWR